MPETTVYAYEIEAYRRDEPEVTREGVALNPSTGGQYRARRVLLDRLYKEGWFVRKITFLESRKADEL